MTQFEFCSGPFWPDAQGMGPLLVSALVETAAAGLAVKLAERPVPGTRALADALLQIASSATSPDVGWAPSLGWALGAASAPQAEGALERAGVALFLDHVPSVHPVRFDLDLGTSTRLKLGRQLLPTSRTVEIDWTGTTLSVSGSGFTATAEVTASGRIVVVEAAESPEDGCRLEPAGRLFVVHGEWQDCHGMLSQAASPKDAEGLHADLEAAQELIRAAAPDYWPWISRMSHTVLPVAPPEGQFASGSARDVPGVITLSAGAGVLKCAESLVHETAHQYYFLASRFAQIVDDEPGRTYFSPLVKRQRPLDKILLAYHAAANVLAFYQLLRASGQFRATDAASYAHAVEDHAGLDRHLHDNPNLCPAGRDIYMPIRTWLQEQEIQLT
jgi:HEXXH motif-containing protein